MWVVSSFLPLLISGAKKRLESLFSWWKAAGALCRRLLRKPPLSKTDDFSEIYCNFFRKPDQTAPNLQEFFQIGNDPPPSLLFVKFFWKIMTKIAVFKAKKIAMNLFRSKMNPPPNPRIRTRQWVKMEFRQKTGRSFWRAFVELSENEGAFDVTCMHCKIDIHI